MTEPSEHARRAAEELIGVLANSFEFDHPGWKYNPRISVIGQHIQSAIDAANAELKAENKELRQQVQDWENQYKLLAARNEQGCK